MTTDVLPLPLFCTIKTKSYAYSRTKSRLRRHAPNGWSLGKISEKLNIPRSTLFEWGGNLQQEIHVLKCYQLEKLQEKYIPSFEEELQQLSSYLTRVERALEKHEFDNMTPEFLVQTAKQL